MRNLFGPVPGLLAAAAALLTACSSSPPPPPVLDLAVTGGAEQNPNADGTPTPVSVHLYQLASTSKFERADIFALIEREQATLGPDLLGTSDLVVTPSEKQAVKQDLKAGTQELGVVVLFRNIDQAQWRASAPVAASGPTKLVLDVGKLSLSLKPAGK